MPSAVILQTLDEVGWVIGGQKGAAVKLGVRRATLTHKMKRLGIRRRSNRDFELPTPSRLRMCIRLLRFQ